MYLLRNRLWEHNAPVLTATEASSHCVYPSKTFSKFLGISPSKIQILVTSFCSYWLYENSRDLTVERMKEIHVYGPILQSGMDSDIICYATPFLYPLLYLEKSTSSKLIYISFTFQKLQIHQIVQLSHQINNLGKQINISFSKLVFESL